MRTSRPSAVLSLIILFALAGCRDPKIRTYRTAKETPPPAAVPGNMGMGAGGMLPPPATPPPAIHFEKPDAWQEQTGKSMRVASFLAAEKDGVNTELAVTTFPGDVGGDFANVNRWRGQISLPPITEVELPAAITSMDLPAGKFQLIDITSADPLLDNKFKARILGAWLKQAERTWFFKMTGDADSVGAQREKFLAFLRTVAFSEAPAPASAENPHALPPVSDMASQAVPPPPPTDNPILWTAPADWKPKALGQMRRGSYSAPGAAGDADVSITMLSAAANPLLENVNRWRRQIGLGPLVEGDLATQTTTVSAGALNITTMDYTNNGNRVLGGILYLGDEAWFFKLSGPDASVAGQKAAFLDFVKSIKTR